jgi:uncharacterized protein with beta-barrel porin domain
MIRSSALFGVFIGISSLAFSEYSVTLDTDTLPNGVDGELRYGIANSESIISNGLSSFPIPLIILNDDMNPFSINTEFPISSSNWEISGGLSNYKILDIPNGLEVAFFPDATLNDSNNLINGSLRLENTFHFFNSTFQGSGSIYGGPTSILKLELSGPTFFNGNINSENEVEFISGDLTLESILGSAKWNLTGSTLNLGFNDESFTFQGSLAGDNASTIKKIGAGNAIFVDPSISTSSFDGTIDILAGKLSLNSNASYPSSSGYLYIRDQAILEVDGDLGSVPIDAKFFVEGDAEILVNTPNNPEAPAFFIELSKPIDGIGVNAHLIKTGVGTLGLNGANGAITSFGLQLNEGEVIFYSPSSLKGKLTSLSDTFLFGSSNLQSDVVIGGEISPGIASLNSIGSFIINGNYTQGSGSNYLCLIKSDSTNSQIIVNGSNATIAGNTTFNFYPLDPLGSYQQGQQFVVMEHQNLVGSYSNVESYRLGSSGPEPIPFMKGVLSYLPNEVILNLQIQFPELGSYNQKQVAAALNTLLALNSPLANEIINSLANLSEEQILKAYDQMGPQIYIGGLLVSESNAITIQNSLAQRIAYLIENQFCPEVCQDCIAHQYPFTFWFNPEGGFLRQSGLENSYGDQVGYKDTMGGITVGFDYQLNNQLFLGLLGAYTSLDNVWNQNQGHAVIDSGYLGGYFGVKNRYAYATLSYLQGFNHFKEDRSIYYGNFRNTMKNSHHGLQSIFHLDVGGIFSLANLQISPFESLTYINQKEDGFQEYGSSLYDLKVLDKTSDYIRNELGFNFSNCTTFDVKKILFDFKLSWIKEFRPHGATYYSKFVNTDVGFNVGGYFPERSLLGTGLSFTITAKEQIALKVYYEGEFGNHFWKQNVGLQWAVSF